MTRKEEKCFFCLWAFTSNKGKQDMKCFEEFNQVEYHKK